MSKKIDLNKTVFELTKQYPELIDIMAKLGFTTLRGMLQTCFYHAPYCYREPDPQV